MNILQRTRLAGHLNHTQTQAQRSEVRKKEFFKPKSVTNVTSHENIACC